MQFGEKLKALRGKRGLTQQEVAVAIGVSRRAYIAYEQENTRPRSQKTYEKLAKALGCNINYLLIEDNEISPGVITTLSALGGVLGTLTAEGLSGGLSAAITTYLGLTGYNKWLMKKEKELKKAEEPLSTTADMFLQYEKRQKQFAAAALGIIYRAAAEKGILCQQGNMIDLKGAGILPDDYLVVTNQKIESWWLIFWAKDYKLDKFVFVRPKDRAGAFITRFATAEADPKRMATIVVDDKELYDSVCEYKNHNSYRGNLSVILVDTDEVKVLKETQISSYYEGDESFRIAIKNELYSKNEEEYEEARI